jgi:hypothetical protein
MIPTPSMLVLISLTIVSSISPHAMAADARGRTYLSVDGPAGPKPKPGTPHLDAITAEYDVMMKNGMKVDIMPEFHFRAPKGNAVILHRELVETDSAMTANGIRNARIAIPAVRQMAGSTIKGGWPCGPGRYHVTLQAWLEDAQGNRGNTLKYTIHCHEQLIF